MVSRVALVKSVNGNVGEIKVLEDLFNCFQQLYKARLTTMLEYFVEMSGN